MFFNAQNKFIYFLKRDQFNLNGPSSLPLFLMTFKVFFSSDKNKISKKVNFLKAIFIPLVTEHPTGNNLCIEFIC